MANTLTVSANLNLDQSAIGVDHGPSVWLFDTPDARLDEVLGE
jgi:hypothetical protein